MSPLILGALALAVPGLALGELGARRWLRSHGGYYRYAPYRRERLRIDAAAMPSVSPVATVDINGDGERGGPPPRPGERAFRALVVGGSAAECYFLDQHETWPAVIERILGEHLSALGVERVHVGNAARSIVPCEHIDFMLRKMLLRIPQLDAVFIMVGASDLVSWMEQKMPPVIPEGRIQLSKLFEEHPEGPWGWKLKQTALWHAARRVNRILRRPVAEQSESGSWLHRVRRMRAQAPHWIEEVPDATVMLDHFGKHLAALVRTAKTKARYVVVIRQPWLGAPLSDEEERGMWNFGMGRPYREEVTTYFTTRVVDALMQQVDARAAAVAEESGALQIDLTQVLERSSRNFYDYLHFTAAGAEIVGREAANALLLAAEARRA